MNRTDNIELWKKGNGMPSFGVDALDVLYDKINELAIN